MRIEIRTSGGFAGNVRRPPMVLETTELEPAVGRELEALAAALPAGGGPPGPPGRGADLMTYEIVIEDEGGRRTASFTEPGAPDALRELLRRAREAHGR